MQFPTICQEESLIQNYVFGFSQTGNFFGICGQCYFLKLAPRFVEMTSAEIWTVYYYL